MEEFNRRVYELVREIPEGSVIAYGQIATMLGRPRGARMVARAMRLVPKELNLPCHRVVNSKGELAPPHVFGGKGVQRRRLEAEGVIFKRNGCIDMQSCTWEAVELYYFGVEVEEQP